VTATGSFQRKELYDAGCVHSHCLLPHCIHVFPRGLLLRVGTYLLFLLLDAGRAAITTAADVPHNKNLKCWTRAVRDRGRSRRAHGSRSFERPRDAVGIVIDFRARTKAKRPCQLQKISLIYQSLDC